MMSDRTRRFSATEVGMGATGFETKKKSTHHTNRPIKIFDDPAVIQGYESVPLIEIDALPRGGISLETAAVGRIQFGIPPETIKDSMLLGMEVPSTFIVPVERFCREMGPALGINLAEFEFPAYFNYFVRGNRVALVVDAQEAERDIRSVFGETLLGPEHYRSHKYPCANVDEDFDPSFPKDARPNFYKEFYNFRTAEKSTNYQELTIDTLLEFVHFRSCRRHDDRHHTDQLGVPPTPAEFEMPTTRQFEPNRLLSPSSSASSSMRRHILYSERKEAEDDLYLHMSGSFSRKELESETSASSTRPALKRSVSASSCSESVSTQNSRRGSMGSVSSGGQRRPGNGERRSSLPASMNKETRKNSMPIATDSLMGSREPVGTFRRDSMKSISSEITSHTRRSAYTRISRMSNASSSIHPYDFMGDEDDADQENHWMYSQAKWLGEVATVYPAKATEEQKRTNKCARVEIFKMAGGTEYIVHDVDDNNIIIGKCRFSGTVRTPDELSVQGFISNEGIVDLDVTDRVDDFMEGDFDEEYERPKHVSAAPTFHPPSFGVTVLGNSHGFDKNGSTSGYVLWVNGRGIMIDPPPYSSATLEREGIRPQMIMAIIITHCHADHDAGAFQKVMTGSRVAIITTPTIYKSFIRKYSALSGLRPTLLRHSHRHRPAIIGQPLRFQGAVFHFTYTLHTIPCISFKVEWRGRSMVFTGDHMNIPFQIQSLEEKGVLSRARAEDLRRLPIQDCDVLLHEAGAPPIHTPLAVLQELPQHVKNRLYVVHTAAIPADSGLRVAPTGTAGTIRLDTFHGRNSSILGNELLAGTNAANGTKTIDNKANGALSSITAENLKDGPNRNLTALGGHHPAVSNALINRFNDRNGRSMVAPLVFLRPTDVSDAWFILNLLSAVPFLSSLSYAHTMEFLEIAHVEMYSSGEVVIEGQKRSEILCVFWEGTCVERGADIDEASESERLANQTVWHAGDWTGPISLQPDVKRSAEVLPGDTPKDIIAVPREGVKVITLLMKDVQRILKSGSKLFRKYLALQERQKAEEGHRKQQEMHQQYCGQTYGPQTNKEEFPGGDTLLDVIHCNSVFSNLTAMQKRYLESLAEGPRLFATYTPLWKVGDAVDYAYMIVSGTATLGGGDMPVRVSRMNRRGSTGDMSSNLSSIAESGRGGGGGGTGHFQPIVPIEADKLLPSENSNSEYAKLEVTLQLRSEEMQASIKLMEATDEFGKPMMVPKGDPVQVHKDRFANKVLARLYARRAYTANLIFSRGNFLSDTSRMVSGDLANIHRSAGGTGSVRSSLGSGSGVGDHHCHTSNLMAGPQGCVVMVFPRATLVPFLDSNPGVLLTFLGTQVVV